LSAASWLAAV